MTLINLFSVAQSMASLRRYSQTTMAAPESVLEHSGFVVLLCYLIGLELNSVAEDVVEEITMGELLSRAIVHDMEEIVVGDVASPTKYLNVETIVLFEKLKAMGIKKVIAGLHLSEHAAGKLDHDHTNAKLGRSGFIVSLADRAAVVYKLWDECLIRHNYTMVKYAMDLRARGLEQLRAGIIDFNKAQSFYLHSLVNNMSEVLAAVAAKNGDKDV